jgi:hypothetical protein
MGLPPITGSWVTDNSGDASDFSGALKWGTGINPIHEVYGEGPPRRSLGRQPGPDDPTPQLSTVPASFENPDIYGYTMEDIQTLQDFSQFSPAYGTDITELRAKNYSGMPDWSVIPTDPERTEFQQRPELSDALWSGIGLESFPTETVSEGWLNKTAGKVLAARTSDPSQYEMQTSMQQVNPAPGRNNGAAVARGTDDPRANIMTRLTGMKIKPWSRGEREIDMFPYQQVMMVRPFSYRTAATGNPADLEPNEMYVSEPIERVVPPDPDLGPQENELADNYGYTDEDSSYG